MAKKSGKGRPAYTPLQKAVSNLAKATQEHDALQMEFNALIGVTDNDKGTERYEDLMEVATSRMCIAQEKDEIIQDIRKAKQAGNEELEAELIQQRQAKEQELREHAPLGFTFDEFDPEDEDNVVELDRGRPSMEIEIRMVRAQVAKQEAEQEAEKLAKEENISKKKLAKMVEEQINKDVKPGRPKNDELGRLDKRLVDIDKKIEHIESGEAEKERLAKQNISEKGNLRGRKPEPFESILERLENDKVDVLNRIELLESKLDKAGKLNRELKILRDKKREVKSLIKAETPSITNAKIEKDSRMKKILQEEDRLMNAIAEADGHTFTKRPAVKRDKTNVQSRQKAQALKDKMAEEAQSDTELADDIEAQEQALLAQLEELRARKAANA